MTDVPSNLIPTRISQLPEYTGSSQEGYLPYVYQGVTYKVRFSSVASAGEVPPSRTLTAGTGLTGGGDLSADRVFAIASGGVGADQLDATGVVAGVYGDASNVPTITVDANGRVSDVSTTPIVALGYVPESRVITAGAGLSGGGNLAGDRSFSVNFSSVAPSPLGSASAGVANVAAREDHVHPAVDLSDMTETQGTLPLGRGGTGASLSPIAGAVAYSTGTHMSLTPVGVAGQVLVSGGVGAPYWLTLTGTGTVTSVNVDGGTSGLNFIGGPITTSGVITLQDPGFIQFDTAASPARATGRLWWNDDDNAKTFVVGGEGGNVDIKVGEQNYFRVKASAAITKGQVVMFTGTVGASGGLQGAPATGLTVGTASYIMGIAAEDIPLNEWGYVTQFGLIRQLNTTAFSDGDILYYDPSVAGGLRVGAPPAPAAKAEMAAVVLSASNGSIFVRATSHFSIEQLNDVETAAASNLDLLEFNGASGVWRHRDPQTINVGGATNVLNGAANQIVYQTGSGSSSFIAAPSTANTFLEWSGSAFQWSSNPLGTVTSVDISGGTTGLTASGGPITSSGTITLGGTLGVANGGTGATTAAGALTSLGAYPASNPDGYTTNTGTVTSVAATAGTGISVSGSPITTSGTLTITNTAPDQTVTLTQGGTTTITGTYPNFTISSADQYDGTVTSVAATVPTGFTLSGSPITTSGTLAIGFDTGYSLPTDAEQANWDAAYADRYKWDGGSSGLVAATGRTSLGLGTSAVLDAGAAGGVATLDGGGTVPTSQLPAAVLGALKYQGTWNASTNSPTLTSSVGTQGYYYVVSVAGTTNLDGISDWAVGDWAIFNGSTWDKIDNTDAVTSVNGYTGTVVLDYADVGAPSTTGTGASGTWGINVTGNAANVTGTVAVANGGTGATTAAGALTNLGAYAASNPAGYTTNTGTVTSVAASAGTGISVTGSPITTSGTLTITNTAPDQTVTLTQAGTTTITGTYPNFTISSADQYSGTVTSVGGTGTVNGLTLSGTVTSSGNLTLGGTLAISNADWSGTDLSVANGGTGTSSLTSGYVLKGNGTSAVSASVIYDSGTNVGIGTSSPTDKLTVDASTTTGISVVRAGSDRVRAFGDGTLAWGATANQGTLTWNTNLAVIQANSGNSLAFNTNGTTERMRITSTGLVGIGTSSPADKLHVDGNIYLGTSNRTIYTGGAGNLVLQNNTGVIQFLRANGASESMRIDSSGNVGIGTGSPDARLRVSGNTNSLQARFANVDGRGLAISTLSSAGTNDNGVIYNAGVFADAQHVWQCGGTERMRIDSSGNVGIGRVPSAWAAGNFVGLQVGLGASIAGRAGAGTEDQIYVSSNAYNDGAWKYIGTGAAANYYQDNGEHVWRTAGSGTAGGTISFTERMRIDSAGNVGIGVTPAAVTHGPHLDIGSTRGTVSIGTGYIEDNGTTQFFNGTRPLAFGIAGSERMRIDSSGYLLVNRSSRSSSVSGVRVETEGRYGSTVTGSAGYSFGTNGTSFTINDYSNGSTETERMRITSAGLVGIGTSSPTQTLQVQGTGYATGDFRAPIFYDSGNTAYYLDASSTGTSLNVAGTAVAPTFNATSTVGGGFQGIDGDSATAPSFTWTSDLNSGMWKVADDVVGITAGGNDEFRVYTSYTLALGSSRAPIFYDSDNTAYYADLASTSSSIRTAGPVSVGTTSSAVQLTVAGASGADGIELQVDASNAVNSGRMFWTNGTAGQGNAIFNGGGHLSFTTGATPNSTSGATRLTIYSSGYNQSHVQFRAPIFYDSDNTAYYLDASSTGTSLNVAGSIVAAGNVTAYSDIRVKDNVEQIGNALERLQAIRGVTYTRNDLEDKERRYAGVIAQEIEEVLPEAVFDNGDRKAVDYNATIGLLIEAIKELKAEVETLKKG